MIPNSIRPFHSGPTSNVNGPRKPEEIDEVTHVHGNGVGAEISQFRAIQERANAAMKEAFDKHPDPTDRVNKGNVMAMTA